MRVYRCLVGMDFQQVTYRRNDLLYSDRHNGRDIEELVRRGRLVEVMTDGSAPGGSPTPKRPSDLLPAQAQESLKVDIRPVVIGIKPADEEAKPARRSGRPPGSVKDGSKGGFKGTAPR